MKPHAGARRRSTEVSDPKPGSFTSCQSGAAPPSHGDAGQRAAVAGHAPDCLCGECLWIRSGRDPAAFRASPLWIYEATPRKCGNCGRTAYVPAVEKKWSCYSCGLSNNDHDRTPQ